MHSSLRSPGCKCHVKIYYNEQQCEILIIAVTRDVHYEFLYSSNSFGSIYPIRIRSGVTRISQWKGRRNKNQILNHTS